jgi:phenylacetate-CoA ligase
MRWTTAAFASLYYAVQRVRGGVRSEHVQEFSRLLDSDAAQIEDHVRRRLAVMYGLSGDPLEWLRFQPPIERTMLHQAASRIIRERRGRMERRRTSGSTGTPFQLVKDMAMAARMDAAMWAAYAWHGIAPGASHVRFWGRPLDRMSQQRQRLSDTMLNRRRLSAFDLAPEPIRRFHALIRSRKPDYVYGYPTLIRHFVEECVKQGLCGRELGVRVVVTTGEMLVPDARSVIRDYFGARVVNEYGCTESGILGLECEAGDMHVIPLAAFPEVIGGNAGTAVEQEGEIVVTDLYGELMPLLRYRLHDRGTINAAACACGRALPRLDVTSGRIDSFIQTPVRGPVYDAVLAYTVPRSVQRFRAKQVALNRIEVDIVPGEGFQSAETPLDCQQRWESVLGPGMEVIVRVREHIPYELSGKLRYFVPFTTPLG